MFYIVGRNVDVVVMLCGEVGDFYDLRLTLFRFGFKSPTPAAKMKP